MNKQLKKTMDQLTPKRLKKTLETQHSSGSESSFGTDDKIREIPKKAATQLDEFFEQDPFAAHPGDLSKESTAPSGPSKRGDHQSNSIDPMPFVNTKHHYLGFSNDNADVQARHSSTPTVSERYYPNGRDNENPLQYRPKPLFDRVGASLR